MSDPPVGQAQPKSGGKDKLAAMLTRARQHGTRGTLRTRRELWRFCAVAYRDWSGIQLVRDPPLEEPEPLTKLELAELLTLADELPTVIRDLLQLHRQASVTRRQITLRQHHWSAERLGMLIELHELALFGAGAEKEKARRAYMRTAAESRTGNYDARCKQRERMVIECQRQIDLLESQLQALRPKS